jgi:hypothetical protein
LTDTVVLVNATKGLEAVDATDGGPRGQPVFHDKQAVLAMDVELLRVAHLGFPDEVVGLEETTLGVAVVLSILVLREHRVSIIRDREFTTYGGNKSNSQLKLKTRRQ